MSNENDLRFNIINECANRILKFKADLKKATSKEEKEHLAFLMSEQEVLIQEYTDAPLEYVLRYVTKINDLKQTLENEQKPERRKILENTIETYTRFITSDIYNKTLKQEDKSSDSKKSTNKCTQYRESQKCDYSQIYDLELLHRAKDLKQICEKQQAELKAKENNSEMELD